MAATAPQAVFPEGEPRHGGDLEYATARYGEPAAGWLDLSTGINPEPWPVPTGLLADVLHERLPLPGTLDRLIAAARGAAGIAGIVPGVAGPGSDLLLRLIPRVSDAGDVAIVGPTYVGHREAWQSAGRRVRDVTDPDRIADEPFAVICNPNSPDGRAWPPGGLAALATRLGRRGGLLVIDEAFGEIAPQAGLAAALHGLPAVVLRSFGKFHGLAGLRVGFAFGDAATIARLRDCLGAWPLSGAAIAVAGAALADTAWADATRRRLAAARGRLDALLADAGLGVAGGTSLFALVEDDRAAEIHRRLAVAGVWTRRFQAEPRRLRIGLPPAAGWARLAAALGSIRP